MSLDNPSLCFHDDRGNFRAFPWSDLLALRYVRNSDSQVIELYFSISAVTITGKDLEELRNNLLSQSILWFDESEQFSGSIAFRAYNEPVAQ